MIISENQARLAAEYLREHPEVVRIHRCDVSAELIAEARATALHAPDMRPECISRAERYLGAGPVDSRQVAEKMIARIISDALR